MTEACPQLKINAVALSVGDRLTVHPGKSALKVQAFLDSSALHILDTALHATTWYNNTLFTIPRPPPFPRKLLKPPHQHRPVAYILASTIIQGCSALLHEDTPLHRKLASHPQSRQPYPRSQYALHQLAPVTSNPASRHTLSCSTSPYPQRTSSIQQRSYSAPQAAIASALPPRQLRFV